MTHVDHTHASTTQSCIGLPDELLQSTSESFENRK